MTGRNPQEWLSTGLSSRLRVVNCRFKDHTAEVRPGMKSIAAGTFDETDWFAIDRHIWVQSKLPWVTIPKGVAAYPKAFNPSLQEDVNLGSKT